MRRYTPHARRMTLAGVLLAGGLMGCATAFRLPAPVPAPLHQRVLPLDTSTVRAATLAAFEALGLEPAATKGRSGRRLTTRFIALAGNEPLHRSLGVARFVLDRDVYSAGRLRLYVEFMSQAGASTTLNVAADPQARLQEVGEIRYEDPEPAEGRPTPPQIARSEPTADGWVALRSNGVLEDHFFAELLRALGDHASTLPARSSHASRASPH